jgi:hypothetical protein
MKDHKAANSRTVSMIMFHLRSVSHDNSLGRLSVFLVRVTCTIFDWEMSFIESLRMGDHMSCSMSCYSEDCFWALIAERL